MMVDNIIRILSYIISCTIGTIIIYDFMEKMFNSQCYIKRLKIVIFVIFTILWFAINRLGLPMLNLTYFVGSTLLIGIFLYNTRHFAQILQIFTFIISYAACDIIISSILSVINGFVPILSNNSLVFLLNVIIVETFMVVFCKFLILFFKKQSISYLYKKQYIFLALIPIFNAVILYAVLILAEFKTDQNITHLIMTLMAVISSVLNIAVLYFFENISKSNQLENDIILMRQRIGMQYNYYQQLEIEYNNSQTIMHDIKNHLKVLERLYNSDQKSEGLQYAQKITEIVEELGMKFKCNSQILNIIVNEKMKICNINKIEFIYSIENLSLSFIDDIDITAIFANLLDNAIEACKKIINQTKQIELRVYQFNNMLIINLINSVDSAPVQNAGKFISSKKDHKAIGLSNVRTSVQKYDGDMNIEIEQGKFSVSIMFPIKKEVN